MKPHLYKIVNYFQINRSHLKFGSRMLIVAEGSRVPYCRAGVVRINRAEFIEIAEVTDCLALLKLKP